MANYQIRKAVSSQDAKDTMQANSDKERESFQKIYGFVPKNQDNIKKGYTGEEKDKWEAKRKGLIHKDL